MLLTTLKYIIGQYHGGYHKNEWKYIFKAGILQVLSDFILWTISSQEKMLQVRCEAQVNTSADPTQGLSVSAALLCLAESVWTTGSQVLGV